MGLERVFTILSRKKSPFETDLFAEVIEEIRTLAGGAKTNNGQEDKIESERIIADHLRSATFILGDQCGVVPSNTDQGYILRRLIRRAIRHGRKLGIETDFCRKIAGIFVKNYSGFYKELNENAEKIFEEMANEESQFNRTLSKGIHLIHKELDYRKSQKEKGASALGEDFCFEMFATYGFPIEMTIEELSSAGWIKNEKDKKKILQDFEKYYKKH